MKITDVLNEGLDPKSLYQSLAKMMPNFSKAYQQVAQQKDKLKAVINSLSSRDQAVTKDTVKAAVAKQFPTANLQGTVVDKLARTVAAQAQTPALNEVIGAFGLFLIILIAVSIAQSNNSNKEFPCERCGQTNPPTAKYCRHCGTDWEPWYAPSDDIDTEPKSSDNWFGKPDAKKAVAKPKVRSQAEWQAEKNRQAELLRQQGKSEEEIEKILYPDS